MVCVLWGCSKLVQSSKECVGIGDKKEIPEALSR